MDTLHDAQSMFFHALCNLLNIYRSEKCLKQKWWGEMKQHFYEQCNFSLNVTDFEIIDRREKICQEYYAVHVFPSLHEVVSFKKK
jgi:hypothetical protein